MNRAVYAKSQSKQTSLQKTPCSSIIRLGDPLSIGVIARAEYREAHDDKKMVEQF